jgi:hypothetical protein
MVGSVVHPGALGEPRQAELMPPGLVAQHPTRGHGEGGAPRGAGGWRSLRLMEVRVWRGSSMVLNFKQGAITSRAAHCRQQETAAGRKQA